MTKAILYNDAVTIQEDADVSLPPVKVCMHVLGVARTDVRVMRAATALVEAGCKVDVVDVEEDSTRPLEEDIQGIRMNHLKMPNSFASTRFKRWTLFRAVLLLIRGIFRLLQTKADIYHAHDVPALPACYIAALLRHKRLVFEAHEMPLSELPLAEMGLSRRFLHSLLGVLLRLMVSRCTGVITVSPPIIQEIAKRYHIPSVTLIRNVPLYQIVPKTDRLRQKLGIDPEVRIALYQGNIQPDRGLDKVVRAARFLEQKIVIVMMGKGVGETPAQLKSLIASEGVADRIKIIPPVLYSELLQWTASADIGLTITPLDYTLNMRWSLPNKFFEYLMAGLPVLTSPLDAVSEIVTACEVGQVTSSFAPEKIGAAINAMLADREALACMRQNALRVAQSEFCWEKESPKLVRMYRDMLETSHLKENRKHETMGKEDNPHPPTPKIAYILGSFPSLSTTFILQEILELERQGLQLHLFALTEPSNSEVVKGAQDVQAPIMFLSRLSLLPLILAAVRCSLKSPLRFLYTSAVLLTRYRQKAVLRHILYASYLTKRMKQAGITHVHAHFATNPTSVAQAVYLLTGISYSFMAHAFDIYLSPESMLIYKMRMATFVATCSNYTKHYLANLVDQDTAKRLHCIYVGLDLQGLPSNTSVVSIHPPLILAVARLIEKKGLSYLLHACKILKDQGYDFTCRIVGDGLLRTMLEREIDELGLTGRVKMWGAETNERILEMYQQATIMTLPCIVGKDGDRDGLPRVLAEALYMGVPVVTTPVSGIPELITSEVNGLLVPPRDSSALASALARMLDDPSLRQRLATAGQRSVTKQFDLPRNIGSLRDLLCAKEVKF